MEAGGANSGTISGKVFINTDYSGGTYVGTADAIVTVSTEAMSVEVSVATDATGEYTLTGLPSGTVTITATQEGLTPKSIKCNYSTVNFVLANNYDPPAGTATIRGTVEGISDTTECTGITLSNLSGIPLDPTISIHYNVTLHTYEVTNAPDSGQVYVGATNPAGRSIAYGTLDMTGGGVKYLNISREAGVTVDATSVIPPPGFAAIRMSVNLANDTSSMFSLFLKQGSIFTYCKASNLPPLQSSDSYMVEILATNEARDTFTKLFYGCSAGAQTFDMTASSIPASGFVTFPTSGEVLTGTVPTFEWTAISWADYYQVNVYDVATMGSTFVWTADTTDTKISMPISVKNMMGSGSYYFSVYAEKSDGVPTVNLWDTMPVHTSWLYELHSDDYATFTY